MCASQQQRNQGYVASPPPYIETKPPSDPVTPQDKSTKAAIKKKQDRTRDIAKRNKGRRSTILTGPKGLEENATIQRKTLLGQ